MDVEDAEETKSAPVLEARKVLYCGVCGFPAEFCEYGPDFRRCVPWLKQHAPSRLDTDDKLQALLAVHDALGRKKPKGEASEANSNANTSDAAAAPVAAGAGGATGGEGGAAAAPAKDDKKDDGKKDDKKKKPAAPQVVVTRNQRSKRKFITVVSGLHLFGVQGKDACSALKKKFACGVSQVKGSEDLEIQGDVTMDIVDFICDQWPDIPKKSVKVKQDK